MSHPEFLKSRFLLLTPLLQAGVQKEDPAPLVLRTFSNVRDDS
jgi:hypothetical protein